MENNENVPYNYYDYQRGWDHTNDGWYKIVIENTSPRKHLNMIKWLYDKIDNPERHARWIMFEYGSGFKFRYERDYILFTLSWS